MQAGNWPLTLALYEQQAALLRSAGMKYKLLTHLYTYSTLLYVRCLEFIALQPSSQLQGTRPESSVRMPLHASCIRAAGAQRSTTTPWCVINRNAAVEAEPLAREGVALACQLLPSKDDEVVLRTLRCACAACAGPPPLDACT